MNKKDYIGIKENTQIFVLYVNITNHYNSFRIEKVKYLGALKNGNKINNKHIHVVESIDEQVNYVSLEDMFKTEKEAELRLAEIINDKWK